MPLSKNRDPHIDWSRFGKKSRAEINAEAAKEKKSVGLSGRYKRFRAHVNGKIYDISIPNVRMIREQLNMTQAEFAKRFHLSQRTIQQWEQGRSLPDMPAIILLKAIEKAPKIVAEAAAEVGREISR